ncbi:putative cadmium-transporting ATPase [Lacunisphaera limnophila]|uniref:P-type Zn(2+) transporter n=1 Tax=Lacunisphaera limnophila TaxID=1838286 RepID=A0A1D8AT64_9BACT|nr:heavy metal translocating P-type ATPase [Lacunisphaera limnophila]AOS44083.1 putative cadmium-transporting ATPase [Lacunisphaera limnophila]
MSEDDHSHEPGCEHPHDNRRETVSLLVSGVLVGAALLAGQSGAGGQLLTALFAGTGMLAGGWFLLPKAWRSVRRLQPDINLLVVFAAIGASVIGEWVEASAVVFLFGVAEWLEGWADRRARRATEALLELAPKIAVVKRDGRFVEVSVDQVALGETVATKSGMGIPLDGVVLSGESAVNQAPITGESVPVDKKPGDTVFAGTINGEGSLEIKVTKTTGDTTLARIIRLVAEAQEQKAPTQRFVDVFARYYTPAVTAVALLVFLVPPLLMEGDWNTWLYRACVLLIIACPCALVISTPVSIVAGLTALARRGVLVKGGAHLETIGRLKGLAVDKTGTITEGKPQVLGVELLGSATMSQVLAVAASIDDHSAHPLAKAVVAHAKFQKTPYGRATKYQARSGRGAEGLIDGHAYFVGNHRFAHELGVCSESVETRLAAIEARGQSVVVVGHRPHDGCKGEVLGIIAIGDTLRPNAKAAIAALHEAGVEQVVMLSGDNQRTAEFIARQVGIDEARGDLLPNDKVEAVKALRAKHGVVGMVGDGVNDAPAMATANIGIAMGAAGTDAAIETADIALMQDELGKIAETIRLGRRTLGIIHFNIAFALSLKAVFLVLTLIGYASLWLAIMADTGATLLVIANALRLLAAPKPSTQ